MVQLLRNSALFRPFITAKLWRFWSHDWKLRKFTWTVLKVRRLSEQRWLTWSAAEAHTNGSRMESMEFFCFLIFLFRRNSFHLSFQVKSCSLSVRRDALSIDTHLSSNLVAALTSLNVDDFTHFLTWGCYFDAKNTKLYIKVLKSGFISSNLPLKLLQSIQIGAWIEHWNACTCNLDERTLLNENFLPSRGFYNFCASGAIGKWCHAGNYR